MPSTSSVGWLGWSRELSRPGRPSVLLARTTTSHLAATVIRSRFDISFDAAAVISGVRPGAIARRVGPRGLGLEQPLAELADGEAGDRAVGGLVERVLDQARDLVVLVRHDRVGAELGQGQLRQHRGRRDPLDRVARRHPGEVVARPRRAGLREHLLDRGERVPDPANRGLEPHGRVIPGTARPRRRPRDRRGQPLGAAEGLVRHDEGEVDSSGWSRAWPSPSAAATTAASPTPGPPTPGSTPAPTAA